MKNIIRQPFRYVFWNSAFMLIVINIGIYFLTQLYPLLQQYGALNVILFVKYKMYWQVFTYMFFHGSIGHLLGNMIGLLFFGITLERRMGSKEFLLLYLLSGFLSGVGTFAVYYFTGAYTVFLLGASGAIYAILLAYAVLFPHSRIYIWGILPVPAPILVLIYAIFEVGNQFIGAGSGIAHITHLFGFLFAWLYFLVRTGINPLKVWKDLLK